MAHDTPQSARIDKQGGVTGTALTLGQAKRIITARLDMLASLRGAIKPTLYEALSAKINFEEASLLDIIGSGEQARADAQRAALPREYFVREPLDPNLL